MFALAPAWASELIELNADNQVDVTFFVQDTYYDRILPDSVLELTASPIGLGVTLNEQYVANCPVVRLGQGSARSLEINPAQRQPDARRPDDETGGNLDRPFSHRLCFRCFN